MASFEKSLNHGRIGESSVAQWLIQSGGYAILPNYLIEEEEKGPRLYTKNGKLIVPDVLALKGEENTTITLRKKEMGIFGIKWFEVKTKTSFTWHRNSGHWQTGIDYKLYNHYKAVQRITRIPVD